MIDYSKYVGPECNISKEIKQKYFQSKKWTKIRCDLFMLRGEKCEDCGNKKNLHIHHLTYENFGDEEPDDLVILCASCHLFTHGLIKKKKKKKFIPKKIILKQLEKKRKRQIKKKKRWEKKKRQTKEKKLSGQKPHFGLGKVIYSNTDSDTPNFVLELLEKHKKRLKNQKEFGLSK